MKKYSMLFLLVLFSLITACSSSFQLENYSSLSKQSYLDDSLIVSLKPGDKIDELSGQLNSQLNVSDEFLYKEKFLLEIIDWMHVKYRYGGTTKRGVDCTGFTQAIYRDILGINLSRSAYSQYHEGIKISNIDNLEFGDLVFFDTGQKTNPGHAGIYLGKRIFGKTNPGKFVHASSSRGVMISKLSSRYWSKRFVGARRIEEANKKLNRKK